MADWNGSCETKAEPVSGAAAVSGEPVSGVTVFGTAVSEEAVSGVLGGVVVLCELVLPHPARSKVRKRTAAESRCPRCVVSMHFVLALQLF